MKRALVAVLTVLAGALVVAAVGFFASSTSGEPAVLAATVVGTAETPRGTLPHATLDLQVYPNSSADVPGPRDGVNAVYAAQGWPFFWPSTSLQVPANSLVTVTITQYDGGAAVFNEYWAEVHGTVDGTMTVNGEVVTGWDKEKMGHTFTIHQYPDDGQPYLFVSVPLPDNPNKDVNNANPYVKDPYVVTFSFMTGDPGTYIWNCEFPCGTEYQEFGGPMQQRGWMSGTLEVV